MARRNDLRNDGDRYLTSNQRAQLKTPPIRLLTPEDFAAFLTNVEGDLRAVMDELSDINSDRKRMARDLERASVVGNAVMRSQNMAWDDRKPLDSEAATLALVLALQKTTTPASSSGSSGSSGVGPIRFYVASNAMVASTETYAGSDSVVGTQAAAGAVGGKPGTVSRVKLNLATAPAAAATFAVKVYATWDGVNFTYLGAATFTGDGATKSFDSKALTTAPTFIAAAELNNKDPQYQVGLLSSANLTSKVGVTLE